MENSIYKQFVKPGSQALLILALYGFAILILKILDLFEFKQFLSKYCWLFGTALLLFYIVLNSLYSFIAIDKLAYFRNSIFNDFGFRCSRHKFEFFFDRLVASLAKMQRRKKYFVLLCALLRETLCYNISTADSQI